jgi:alginate O-acetyltransferase complex protein AlgI
LSYTALAYVACFLPAVILLYRFLPGRFRKPLILCADLIFAWELSGTAVIYIFAGILITHHTGLWIRDIDRNEEELPRKTVKSRKKAAAAAGIVLMLAVLFALKYYNCFVLTSETILKVFHIKPLLSDYNSLTAPVGISYYTLQSISYIADVCSGKIGTEKSLFNLALYLSFFPTIMEGPITRYDGALSPIIKGEDLRLDDLKRGYLRIVWGLFQKLVVADYVALPVKYIFQSHRNNGMLSLMGAVLYTMQLYADFAGTIDIVIGSGRIFGVKITENFRQPFFAKKCR